jgi:hypothetical protein
MMRHKEKAESLGAHASMHEEEQIFVETGVERP